MFSRLHEDRSQGGVGAQDIGGLVVDLGEPAWIIEFAEDDAAGNFGVHFGLDLLRGVIGQNNFAEIAFLPRFARKLLGYFRAAYDDLREGSKSGDMTMEAGSLSSLTAIVTNHALGMAKILSLTKMPYLVKPLAHLGIFSAGSLV